MPLERLIFFAVWLALALLAGALITVVWQRVHQRRQRR
jgi:tryptophan-rich sensory protein